MRGTVLRLVGINQQDERATAATSNVAEWRSYCEEVRIAAEQLRNIASQAENAARNADTDRVDLSRAMAREVGLLGSPSSHRANMYATMMLGPFAALEELRRQIRPG